MAEKIKSINLLPNRGSGLFDQFLAWALTIGRLLIILTETLALGTFLYRFSIDMKIIDLHDLIKNQRIIVEQFKSTEESARNLQARLAFVKEQESESGTTPSIFSDIINMGSGAITFKSLAVSKMSAKIEVQSSSSGPLNNFINKLKTHPEITSVQIDSIENKTSTASIGMSITAGLKQPKSEQVGTGTGFPPNGAPNLNAPAGMPPAGAPNALP